MKIYILGLGAGNLDLISKKAYELLRDKSIIKIARTKKHEIIGELEKENINFIFTDFVYEEEENFENVYERISDIVIKYATENDEIIYAVPGSPFITEDTTNKIIQKAEKQSIEIQIIPSVSFIDASICSIRLDPTKRMYITDVFNIDINRICPLDNILISQVYDRFKASELKIQLMQVYEDEQEIYIISASGSKNEKVRKVLLYKMDHKENEYNHLTSVFIKAVDAKKMHDIYDMKTDGKKYDKTEIIKITDELEKNINEDDDEKVLQNLSKLMINIKNISDYYEKKSYFSIRDVVDNAVKIQKI